MSDHGQDMESAAWQTYAIALLFLIITERNRQAGRSARKAGDESRAGVAAAAAAAVLEFCATDLRHFHCMTVTDSRIKTGASTR